MLAYIGHQHHEDRDAGIIRKCLGFVGYCVERRRRGKGVLYTGALPGMNIMGINKNNNNSNNNNNGHGNIGYQNGS